ncbi:wall-associated receptor kinase 5-like isoform X1 [Triticum urartu]|uniref:Protein kinase domain-containing protein n=2 Tax=Triticum urartu TaxID=4572 RepID=A0A8R7UBB5_TRIUA|nr:wall-associated receptor kinase 5-like [Triticum dicoccoides]XP_048528186.1 wall-associated receptor kinase 5-like isoform X1 [Triticum urartu]
MHLTLQQQTPALVVMLYLKLIVVFLVMALAKPAGGAMSLALPGCPDRCGDVPIPYPFGIGAQCAAVSLSSFFNLDCENTSHPLRPTVGGPADVAVNVADISLERGEMRVLIPVSYICFTSSATVSASNNNTVGFGLEDTPFLPSPGRNRFMVIGCNTLGLVGGFRGGTSQYLAGCYSYCDGASGASDDGAPCTGTGCCEASIPTNLTAFNVAFPINSSSVWGFNPCFYAMVAEVGWYRFQRRDLAGELGFINNRAKDGAPVIVNWAVRNGSCLEQRNYACVSANSYCESASNGPGYLCHCSPGYEGNAYLNNGCQDIDECMLREQDPKYEELYPCRNGVCLNTPGGYDCKCKKRTKSDGTKFGCRPLYSRDEQLLIGLSVSAVVIISLACFLAMQLQRKKHRKEKDEYFKQNGGLMLYDEMRSRQVDTVRILTEKEIKIATDNYNEDRVLGCGGHGMVYKGTLDDLREVAIKKSKVIDDDCRDEFVNEIIILSQINHRNIVRLLGCCLDIDVPVLVYEFVSNGTLYEFLHGGPDHNLSPIPLDLRLKIATQSAEALAYLHSSTSRTILHGDVKSANILLDDQRHAKVADFGASALKSMDESEFIMLVQGTLGYLDPESFISHVLTDKSDVYSFGVVLLELLTRKRALYADRSSKEKRSLSHSFLLMFDQNMHLKMLDSEIAEDAAAMVVVEKLAALAVHCLSVRGDDRPTMKEVAERLQVLWRIQMRQAGDGDKDDDFGGGSLSPVVLPSAEVTDGSLET